MWSDWPMRGQYESMLPKKIMNLVYTLVLYFVSRVTVCVNNQALVACVTSLRGVSSVLANCPIVAFSDVFFHTCFKAWRSVLISKFNKAFRYIFVFRILYFKIKLWTFFKMSTAKWQYCWNIHTSPIMWNLIINLPIGRHRFQVEIQLASLRAPVEYDVLINCGWKYSVWLSVF